MSAAAACRCGRGAPAGSNDGEASVPGAQEGRKGGRAVCLTLEMRSACGRRPVARLGCGGVGDFIDGLRRDRARRRSPRSGAGLEDACPRCRTLGLARTCRAWAWVWVASYQGLQNYTHHVLVEKADGLLNALFIIQQ